MKVLLFGATGMIGYGVLLECLEDEAVDSVVTVGRRRVTLSHPKLEQILHDDFTDFSAIADRLTDFDACFWCLGVSAAGMSEEKYRRITVDFTLAAAKLLVKSCPNLTFCFISGAGTSRDGGQMWARVKAEAEDKLAALGFASYVSFRPALIMPKKGTSSTITSYRVLYALMKPFSSLLEKMPKYVTTTPDIGKAMIRAAREGAAKQTLENIDICELAKSP